MIKCKNDGCPKNYTLCCKECEELQSCNFNCEEKPNECGAAIFEGNNELEVFESKAAVVIKAIANLVTQKKSIEEQEQAMRLQLEKAMNEHNIKSFENELIKITIVEPTTKTTLDGTKLKKELPEIHAKYSKVSSVKGSIRITVK